MNASKFFLDTKHIYFLFNIFFIRYAEDFVGKMIKLFFFLIKWFDHSYISIKNMVWVASLNRFGRRKKKLGFKPIMMTILNFSKTESETYQSFLIQLWKLSPCTHCTPYLLLSLQPETVHQPLQNTALNLASLQSSILWYYSSLIGRLQTIFFD